MTEKMSDREYLDWLAARPIGGDTVPSREAAERACKVWLPNGRRPLRTPEIIEREAALKAGQTDLEDAVEQAGGERGHLNDSEAA